MAMFISFRNIPTIAAVNNSVKEWHVGEGGIDRTHIRYVESVQADGHELEYIKNRFHNLPNVTTSGIRVVTWWGDDAKFIADNL